MVTDPGICDFASLFTETIYGELPGMVGPQDTDRQFLGFVDSGVQGTKATAIGLVKNRWPQKSAYKSFSSFIGVGVVSAGPAQRTCVAACGRIG